MIFLTFCIALAISLIFLFLRGNNRTQNQNNLQINKSNQSSIFTQNSRVDKYTNVKTYLEKSFAKKREQKSKLYFSFV